MNPTFRSAHIEKKVTIIYFQNKKKRNYWEITKFSSTDN
jgi:hypothetical protein